MAEDLDGTYSAEGLVKEVRLLAVLRATTKAVAALAGIREALVAGESRKSILVYLDAVSVDVAECLLDGRLDETAESG